MPKKAAGDSAKRTTKKVAKTATKRAATKKKTATAAAKAPAATVTASGTRLRVRQVRSGIGHAATYRRTLRALGLRHHQDEVVVTDSPATRGALRKVRHLVRVTPEEA